MPPQPGNRKMMRRIHKELEKLRDSNSAYFTFIPPSEDDIRNFNIIIHGPPDTPYETGNFLLSVKIPDNYPYHSASKGGSNDGRPQFRFISKIYHPNISKNGLICLDILHGNYTPSSSIESLVISLISMFMDPNTNSPMNSEAAHLFDNDRTAFNNTVKKWIDKYGYKITDNLT